MPSIHLTTYSRARRYFSMVYRLGLICWLLFDSQYWWCNDNNTIHTIENGRVTQLLAYIDLYCLQFIQPHILEQGGTSSWFIDRVWYADCCLIPNISDVMTLTLSHLCRKCFRHTLLPYIDHQSLSSTMISPWMLPIIHPVNPRSLLLLSLLSLSY
jgi:hypothetical protein